MKALTCPRCGEPIIECGPHTLDLTPGDGYTNGAVVTARLMLTVDGEGVESCVELFAERLAAARRDRIALFRRHTISCAGYWPR